jgi:hypothetical protein
LGLHFTLLFCGTCLAQNVTTSADITFAWDSNTETDLAGYRLYQSDTGEDGTFDQCLDHYIPPSDTPEVIYPTVVTIGVGQTLCFAVTAFNTTGVESDLSDVVCHTDNTCIPLPAENQTLLCPSGQTGSITQTRISTCPGPVWGLWTTTNNSCKSAACVADAETRNSPCPAGQVGYIIEYRASTCPDSLGPPMWGPWTPASSACHAVQPCLASTENRTLQCPTDFTGRITESRSSSCPDQNGSPVWGEWVQTFNTCSPIQACAPHTETRTIRCTDWWFDGRTVQQRTSNCENCQEISSPWETMSTTCTPLWEIIRKDFKAYLFRIFFSAQD